MSQDQRKDDLGRLIEQLEVYDRALKIPPRDWRALIARAPDHVKTAFVRAFADAAGQLSDCQREAILAFIAELDAQLPPEDADHPEEPDDAPQGDGWPIFEPWK